MLCVSNNTNGLVIASFFGNRCATLLDAEIKNHICETQKCSKQEFIDILSQKYSIDDITAELDRQCSFSTLRYVPSEDAYTGVEIGMNLWDDMCSRIHDQESVLAGQLQRTGSCIKVDIYGTDFQVTKLKEGVKFHGLNQAPVMRWTKKFEKKDALKCLDLLMAAVPFTDVHSRGDRSCVIHLIGDVIDRKPKKTPWAWMVCHSVVQLELTPSKKDVLETVFSLSNGPVDWNGTPVSLDEIEMNTKVSRKEISGSLVYLQEKGIVRMVKEDFAPTDQGYVLVRHAFRSDSAVTFVVTHKTDKEYQLEVSTPSYLNCEMQDLLKEWSGTRLSEFHTPAVFPLWERSQVVEVMDAIITKKLSNK